MLPGSGERFLFLPSVFFAVFSASVIKDIMVLRGIYPILLILFTVKGQFSWIKASDYTKSITDKIRTISTEQVDVNTIFIAEPIDSYNGAYALRNGSDKLGSLFGNNVKTFPITVEELEQKNIVEDGSVVIIFETMKP
jgi:hypothetical protein